MTFYYSLIPSFNILITYHIISYHIMDRLWERRVNLMKMVNFVIAVFTMIKSSTTVCSTNMLLCLRIVMLLSSSSVRRRRRRFSVRRVKVEE